MKCLQTLLVASVLVIPAGLVHASSAGGTQGDAVLAAGYVQDGPQSGIRHSASQDGGDSSDPATRADDDTSSRTTTRLPSSNGKAADPAPADNVRAPSWQSLLPGSIQ